MNNVVMASWSIGKTPPFHGGMRGPTPLEATKQNTKALFGELFL